ncbi:MAG: PTPDL family protein [Chthoniobacterales bacterium]
MIPRLLIALLCLPLAIAAADTIKMKSGEVIEGRIINADDKSVTIEVQYSPTITDQRTLSRADIAQFAVEAGDEAAFAKIRDVKSPDTALGTKTCQKLIDEKLLPFLHDFPNSPRTADVQLKLRDLRNDIARLKAGSVKVAGVWYDKDDFTAEKYQIEAAAVLDAMRRNYETNNYPGAMNSFDLLQRAYPDSLAYVESLRLAPDLLDKLQQQINLDIVSLPQTKALRLAAIDRTPIEQRQPIQRAMAAEDAQVAAAAALAQQKQQKFYAIYAFDEKGLQAMQASALQIEKQLAAADSKALASGARLVRRASEELESNQFAGAQTTLEQLRAEWPRYEGLSRMETRLHAAQDANKASAKAAADAEKKQP